MAPIEEGGSFWVFDPSGQTWAQITPENSQLPYPVGRSYHTLASNGKDTIYVHAGCPEKGRLNDLWAFKVFERKWTELSPAPEPARGGTSMTFSTGKLFRMNGFDGKNEQGGSLDIFDPLKNAWSTISYCPDGVSGPSARSVSCLLPLVISDRSTLLTMFGEGNPSNLGHQGAGKMLADVWTFDIESRTWNKVQIEGEELPVARGWFDADVVQDSPRPCIVVHGGLAESNERLDDLWLLDF